MPNQELAPRRPLRKAFAWILAAALPLANAAPSLAGEQAQKALAGVKALIAEGKVKPGDTLHILAKEGNVNNFWGKDFEIKKEWEQQTGIRLETRTRQNLPVLEEMLQGRDFDLTISRQREYPDLFAKGLIHDLTPFVKKYGLDFSDDAKSGFFAVRPQTEFDGRTVALPADGDIAFLYLRKDLMEDENNRSRFKAKYGRDLTAPDTWEQYQDLIDFFHNPAAGIYGSCEQRDPANGWMFWMPRYVSRSLPSRQLFDDQMRPLIDSPEGVAATESYVAAVARSPEDITKENNDYRFTVPLYRSGKGFAILQTLALAKILNNDTSPMKGKFQIVPMPGVRIGATLNRQTSFIYGNNLVVSTGSKNPELAFLYAMWFTDPDVSLRSVLMTSGLADPYRFNHLKDERVWNIYTRQAVESLENQYADAVAEGTGLPGDNEYMKALSANLWAAATGKISSKQAMADTARKWEAITEKYGRKEQIRFWKAFRK